jgi:hypothetical protein
MFGTVGFAAQSAKGLGGGLAVESVPIANYGGIKDEILRLRTQISAG